MTNTCGCGCPPTSVEVEGFNLFGGRDVELGTPGPSGRVVRVRNYGVFGGVSVTRC
ncbi:hypothetical protein [Microbispora bryophytorum]|uniref:hypothetical protein n=1 Tax=Microbispora bryophytorum TaxID=1460882 RepID=UPI00340F4AD5